MTSILILHQKHLKKYPFTKKGGIRKLSTREGCKSISGLVTFIECWLTNKTLFTIWKYNVFCKTLETDKNTIQTICGVWHSRSNISFAMVRMGLLLGWFFRWLGYPRKASCSITMCITALFLRFLSIYWCFGGNTNYYWTMICLYRDAGSLYPAAGPIMRILTRQPIWDLANLEPSSLVCWFHAGNMKFLVLSRLEGMARY